MPFTRPDDYCQEEEFGHLDNVWKIDNSIFLTQKEIAILKSMKKRSFAGLSAPPHEFKVIAYLVNQIVDSN